MINHIWAILWKQLKDTLKNKTILIQFLLFPCLTVIMENAISIDGMPEHFFANLFAIMYVGMAPLTAMSAIIAEEKEKNTLRVLHMCNVNAFEYLLGNAIYIVFKSVKLQKKSETSDCFWQKKGYSIFFCTFVIHFNKATNYLTTHLYHFIIT